MASKSAKSKPPSADEVSHLIDLFAMQLFAELELLVTDLLNVHQRHALGWRLLVAAQILQDKDAAEAQAEANKHRFLDPSLVEGCFQFALAQQQLGFLSGAIDCYRLLLDVKPREPDAWNNLSLCLRLVDNLDEAIACGQRALKLRPDFALAHNNLGLMQKDAARIEESRVAYQLAIATDPSYTDARSNLAYLLSFHSGYDAHAIRTQVENLFPDQYPPLVVPATLGSAEKRRLRIGYVSPDFRDHCQSLFTIPLLEHHDKEQFEIICYADLNAPDDYSARIKRSADVWRQTHGMNDVELAHRIADDGVDILVDLTMHMAHGRPLVFARKPAPVQIAWLAYPGTTGIKAMDYRLTDPWLDPLNSDTGCYTERSLRLADTFWCYDPLITDLAPNELPALSNGYITFACLNNFCKVSDASLRLWAKVMARVKDSRLLLLAPQGQHRQHVLEQLALEGIDSDRVEFIAYLPRRDYLLTYHRVDLCLDTLPYNGHTTSLDAYWMGVPVVTQVGNTVAGRAGWSQLNNLGLPELAAMDEDSFVEIAFNLASDIPRLNGLRQGLRQMMENCPLMDKPRFARAMENVFKEAWLHYQAT